MPKRYSRRSALQLCGVAAGISFAGCAATTNVEDPTSVTSSTTTSTQPSSLTLGESASVSQGEVTIGAVETQQMLRVLKAGAHTEVYGDINKQFVIVDVATEGIEEPTQTVRDALELALDSTQYEVVEKHLIRNMEEGTNVSIAFPVPTNLSETTGTIIWNSGSGEVVTTWSVPQETTDVLAQPPIFSVESFSIPETVPPSSSVEVTVTVTNTGRSDGTFIAELGSTQLSDQDEIEVDVPTEETITHTASVPLIGQEGDDETIVLDWGSQMLERTVRIEK